MSKRDFLRKFCLSDKQNIYSRRGFFKVRKTKHLSQSSPLSIFLLKTNLLLFLKKTKSKTLIYLFRNLYTYCQLNLSLVNIISLIPKNLRILIST